MESDQPRQIGAGSPGGVPDREHDNGFVANGVVDVVAGRTQEHTANIPYSRMSVAPTRVRSRSQQVEAGCQFFNEEPWRCRPVFPPPAVDLADLDFDVTGNDDD